jgi:enoyl-CoA hydratase
MKGDRQSTYDQWDYDHHHAMMNEFKIGASTLQTGEARAGAARFAGGRGRGGRFDDL